MNWLKVADQLPEDGQRVWYYFKHTGVDEGHYKRKGRSNIFYGECGFLMDDVTHWMPWTEEEPEAPEDEMTKQQFIFEALKREGECWHETDAENAPLCIHCEKHLHGYWLVTPRGERDFLIRNDEYPDFTTWEGFGWMLERAQEKGWWEDFCVWCGKRYFKLIVEFVFGQLVNPTRFMYALAEYLGWDSTGNKPK